jgi:hypothetical protein
MRQKSMHKSRKQPIAPAPHRTTRAAQELPSTGFMLIVDGQMKGEFATKDKAQARAQELKQRFPALQIRIFDAQEKRAEDVELAQA